jgi:hypothetical protein
MAKLVKLEEKTFEGKHSGYKIVLDDNRSGNMQEKESDKNLREGDDVIVTEIPYTSKAGKTSTLYGLRLNPSRSQLAAAPHQTAVPAPSNKPVSGTHPQLVGKTIEDQKVTAAISAMEFVISAIVNGETDWPKMPELQRQATQLLWDEIDEVYRGKA